MWAKRNKSLLVTGLSLKFYLVLIQFTKLAFLHTFWKALLYIGFLVVKWTHFIKSSNWDWCLISIKNIQENQSWNYWIANILSCFVPSSLPFALPSAPPFFLPSFLYSFLFSSIYGHLSYFWSPTLSTYLSHTGCWEVYKINKIRVSEHKTLAIRND